ncbi:MAG: hypothetical protein IPK16_13815 [Anaerolineales bacterium]|nr:hypothetical protein [Anaerolineales bacterium]
MVTTTMQPVTLEQTRAPVVQYFDLQSTRTVTQGAMVHDYHGVPVWLLKEYLVAIDAVAVNDNQFRKGQCTMLVSPAQRKYIGSLEIGGASVSFSGAEGAIQAVLTELEWKTLRCGG